ncbi:hypothetical protein [Puniceibacterium confluentis]|uniref:hypothetical protein n=1 Tax=Puniceibacterium confluentis TaxID=1958944 RepID=UPI0011B7EF6B|nr:hypothetical protein [Puniceibacterium confluentis]
MRLLFFAFLIVVAWPFALDMAMSKHHDAPSNLRLRDKLISYVAWARIDPEAQLASLETPLQVLVDGCRLQKNAAYGLPPRAKGSHYMFIRGPILTV